MRGESIRVVVVEGVEEVVSDFAFVLLLYEVVLSIVSSCKDISWMSAVIVLIETAESDCLFA